MKIQYKFVNETISIDVSDDWGEILIDLDRLEYNNDHITPSGSSSKACRNGIRFPAWIRFWWTTWAPATPPISGR